MTPVPPELAMALQQLVNPAILLAALAVSIRLLPILLYASMGELLAEKSGVVNLGVEGLMLLGAFTAYMATIAYGSPLVGLGMALLVGIIASLAFAYIAVVLGVNQAVAGLGMWLFGLGITGILYNALAPVGVSVSTIRSPLEVEAVYRAIGYREAAELVVALTNPLVIASIALVPVLYMVIRMTRWGLALTAAGEDPWAADANGVNVYRVRILAVVLGGALAALSGAYLSISYLGDFRYGFTAGRGFMAIAMVYAGNWDPVRAFIASAVLSYIDALQLGIASSTLELARRYYFFNMVPYIAVILLVVILGRRARPPAALMKHFKKA